MTAYTQQLQPGVTEPTTFLGDSSLVGQQTSGSSTYGYYIEPRLNVSSRFFITPGFRLDGGSAGSHASYNAGGVNSTAVGSGIGGLSAFPKIDLSFVAVDQSHPKKMLTLLRPRLAFGLAGTQPAPQDKLRLFNVVGTLNLAQPNTTTQVTEVSLDGGTTFVPLVELATLGNTQLRPERSREVEGGFDAELWHGRFSVTYTQYNKTKTDAIISIPVAPTVFGTTTYDKNIGEIRNTGTELTFNAQVLQTHALSWNVGGNVSNDNNLVVRLNPGQPTICFGDASSGTCKGTRIEAGFPLFGEFEVPVVGFVDANHNGLIEPGEIIYGDSAKYVGSPEPRYQMNVYTNVSLLNGHLSVNATFAYQNGLLQNNQAALTSGSFAQLPNTPGTPPALQAAVVSATCSGIFFGVPVCGGGGPTPIGLMQVVNTFRFNDLSINYTLPHRMASWFRVPTLSMALQGSNLGLHTNYRGKDPNVNAFSTVSAGDQTADTGQIPLPRTWWLKLTMGN